MRAVVLASAGLALAGVPGAVLGLGAHVLLALGKRARHRREPIRPILLLLLVELRSGRSALGALQAVAAAYPGHPGLDMATRVATISRG